MNPVHVVFPALGLSGVLLALYRYSKKRKGSGGHQGALFGSRA